MTYYSTIYVVMVLLLNTLKHCDVNRHLGPIRL